MAHARFRLVARIRSRCPCPAVCRHVHRYPAQFVAQEVVALRCAQRCRPVPTDAFAWTDMEHVLLSPCQASPCRG